MAQNRTIFSASTARDIADLCSLAHGPCQREWQATSDQGLDELIVSPVPKMRLTPTIAISPIETEGPQLDRGRTGQLAAMFALRLFVVALSRLARSHR